MTGSATAGTSDGDTSVLDDPVAHALGGVQAPLGRLEGGVGRFDADVSPFGTLGAVPGTEAGAWGVLARMASGEEVALIGDRPVRPPTGWEVRWAGAGFQMAAAAAAVGRPGDGGRGPGDDGSAGAGGGVVALGPDDADAMLDLVGRSRPGPFRRRTVAFGGYVGVWDGGRLVAMAGERLRPPGHAEISGVTTDPAYRRRGLAARLVRTVAAGIEARGERPFLHVSGDNVDAVRLYEGLGFVVHRRVAFTVLRPPG